MTPAVKKVIAKKIVVNMLMLLVILFLVVAVTGIPMDFNVTSYRGEPKANMEMKEIYQSIENNFKVLFKGEALKVKIKEDTAGGLLFKTAAKSSAILFFGTLLAVVIGIPKGIIDSRKKNRAGTLKLLQSLIPLSVPDILTITMVQVVGYYLFKRNFGLIGMEPLPYSGDGTIWHSIYPIISISILPAAYISRITANIIEDNFSKPYILAARGKGCSRIQIIKNHMMKSILFGVLSGFPTVIGIIFSSLIIVERLFSFRGLGYYLIFFYETQLVPPYEAGIAFTLFIVVLAIFYYFIFMIFNALKEILLPQTKSH